MLKNVLNYKVLIAVIVVLIILIRIPALSSRTIHIDEGMGIRASELVLSGDYKYSPYNGHGPTLFYIGALIRTFAGTNIAYFRLFTVLCLFLTILFIWLAYRKNLNTYGKIILLLALGFSPGLLFFSAYFIHETFFILLTIIAFLSAEIFLETKRGIWLAFFILFSSLMYITKETALFTYAAWFVAGAIILIYQKKYRDLKQLISLKNIIYAVIGCVLSAGFYFLFFGKSLDLILAPYYWLTQRGVSMHLQPWYYFIVLLSLHEFFIMALSAIFFLYITFKKLWGPRLFFFFSWFLFLLVIYSAIPYKTPWLIPNMILPLGLFVAFGASTIYKKTDKILLALTIIILLCPSLVCLWQDNFVHPDRTQRYDYAYLQSGQGFKDFTAVLNGLSQLSQEKPMPLQIIGNGDELLHITTEEYNRFYGPFTPDLPVYINYWHSAEDMKKMAGDGYVFLKFTYFSPGPEIDLFVKKNLWEKYSSFYNFVRPTTIRSDGILRYH